MDERRLHSRHAADVTLEVFDVHSGRRLGRIVDLSMDGFMLFSEDLIATDSVWECRLQPCPPLDELPPVELGADCLWSRPGADNQHCWAGFHIIDIDENNSANLDALIEHL